MTRLILYVHPIQKQHVEMDVQVERRPEALDQGDRPGGGFLAGQSGLLGQGGGDRPGNDTQHLSHQLRVGLFLKLNWIMLVGTFLSHSDTSIYANIVAY